METYLYLFLFNTYPLCFLLGLSNNYSMALFLCTTAMFSKSFHNFGSAVNAMDIAPKHSGSVFGIINTVGSTSGIQNILKFVFARKHFFDFRVHRSLFRWLYSGLDWELVCSLQYYCCDKSCWHNGLCLVWKWCTHCLKSVMILRLNKYTFTFSDIKFKIYILQLYKEIKLSCSLLGYAFLLEPKKY